MSEFLYSWFFFKFLLSVSFYVNISCQIWFSSEFSISFLTSIYHPSFFFGIIIYSCVCFALFNFLLTLVFFFLISLDLHCSTMTKPPRKKKHQFKALQKNQPLQQNGRQNSGNGQHPLEKRNTKQSFCKETSFGLSPAIQGINKYISVPIPDSNLFFLFFFFW